MNFHSVPHRLWRVNSLAARVAFAVVAHSFLAPIGICAEWSLTPRAFVSLASGPVSDIRELSGVTYLGPAAGSLQRFAAIQDENNRLVVMDVDFSANGTINSATSVSSRSLSVNADYEGIAFTNPARNSVFVSEESTPGVHEHSLATGARLKTVALPNVFQNDRDNRGLESLTRSVDGSTMWTANEEALTVDGPTATQAHGTNVRLLRLSDNGVSVTAGPQFVYNVDPIHAGSSPDRSGLSDLVLLPDDTLLALERSRTMSISLQNRIYQVDFADATDVSTTAFASGLDGKTFEPVGKTLLWSGASAGNMEGIALGPQLAANRWVLLAVFDNAGVGPNFVASFELTRSCPLAGDYDCSGAVDGDDYSLWSQAFGSPGPHAADGNGDGAVDAADYVVWRANLAAGAATAQNLVLPALPEPSFRLLALFPPFALGITRRRV